MSGGKSGGKSRLRAWVLWVALSETLIVLVSLEAHGRSSYQRRTGGEGNTVARLFLDDPSFLESMVFYVVLFHVVIGALLLIARWSAVRKRRAGVPES